MYAMLRHGGLQAEFMSFGEVNATWCIPRDGRTCRSLAETAGGLASSAAIDHTYSAFATASGAWVWLRARARTRARRGSSSELHLVGIAVDISDEKRNWPNAARQPTCV